jgi:hypothetical protein
MQEMLEFLGFKTKSGGLCVVEAKNNNAFSTVVNAKDCEEAQALLQNIPLETLALLRNPYTFLTFEQDELCKFVHPLSRPCKAAARRATLSVQGHAPAEAARSTSRRVG